MAPRGAQQMPQLKQEFINGSTNAWLDVYQFNSLNSPSQAIPAIEQHIAQYGASLQYNSSGQTNGYTIYSGQTYYNGVSINWMAGFKATGNGVAGITIGTYANTGTKYQSTFLKILNTLR
jgi:hypothetical protein